MKKSFTKTAAKNKLIIPVFQLILLILLFSITLSPTFPHAALLHFPKGNFSLQDVITKAAPGDTILVAPGTYEFPNDPLIIINESLTIKSTTGPQKTILLGRGKGAVINFAKGSKAVLDGFTVTSATTDRPSDLKGGGIYCSPESAPVILNSRITNNSAVFGGGIYCDSLSAPIIHNNVIADNKAGVIGGGIYLFRSSAIIKNNLLSLNSALNSGGAIGSTRGRSRISNNIIWKNSAGFGGGISCDRAATILTNNTIVGNTADYGGGLVVDRGSVRLSNLIVFQNSREDAYFNQIGPAGQPSFSLIGDGKFRGINGNISQSPRFVDIQKGHFQLQSDSPCINTGNDDPFFEDRDGSYNDMGAYGGPDVNTTLGNLKPESDLP